MLARPPAERDGACWIKAPTRSGCFLPLPDKNALAPDLMNKPNTPAYLLESYKNNFIGYSSLSGMSQPLMAIPNSMLGRNDISDADNNYKDFTTALDRFVKENPHMQDVARIHRRPRAAPRATVALEKNVKENSRQAGSSADVKYNINSRGVNPALEVHDKVTEFVISRPEVIKNTIKSPGVVGYIINSSNGDDSDADSDSDSDSEAEFVVGMTTGYEDGSENDFYGGGSENDFYGSENGSENDFYGGACEMAECTPEMRTTTKRAPLAHRDSSILDFTTRI